MENIKEEIIEQIRTCFDPEIPVNVYDLGLIYNIDINEDKNVIITMTLTSPSCPAAESIPSEIKEKVELLDDVNEVTINLVWEPPFTQDMMSDEAKLALGLL